MKTRLLTILSVSALLLGCGSASTSTKDSSSHETATMQAPALADARAGLSRCGDLFARHCQRCHELPVASRYSVEKWQRIMPAMARKAKIDAMTQDSIATFVLAARAEGK